MHLDENEPRNVSKDVFKILSGTSLGLGGAFLVVQSLLLATGTDIGAVGGLKYWLFGFALEPVASFAIPGVLLIFLAKKAFTPENAMNGCVKMAYKLLERQ